MRTRPSGRRVRCGHNSTHGWAERRRPSAIGLEDDEGRGLPTQKDAVPGMGGRGPRQQPQPPAGRGAGDPRAPPRRGAARLDRPDRTAPLHRAGAADPSPAAPQAARAGLRAEPAQSRRAAGALVLPHHRRPLHRRRAHRRPAAGRLAQAVLAASAGHQRRPGDAGARRLLPAGDRGPRRARAGAEGSDRALRVGELSSRRRLQRGRGEPVRGGRADRGRPPGGRADPLRALLRDRESRQGESRTRGPGPRQRHLHGLPARPSVLRPARSRARRSCR